MKETVNYGRNKFYDTGSMQVQEPLGLVKVGLGVQNDYIRRLLSN